MDSQGTESANAETGVSLKDFLEKIPPGGQHTAITDLGADRVYSSGLLWGASISRPEILLYCDTPISCAGFRLFTTKEEIKLAKNGRGWVFIKYTCKNCSDTAKTFAVRLTLNQDCISGTAYKCGEYPQFGPPTPPRLTTLIRNDKDLFLKGRRAENQGMGIAAFAYYRRVVDNQRERIFDEIIKVCKVLSADQAIIDDLSAAKKETQFTKAIEAVKHGIPEALFINGHNPLNLLYSALSDGLHGRSDEECLELATDVRTVMAEFAERMGQAMKEEAELTTAVTRLLRRRAATPADT